MPKFTSLESKLIKNTGKWRHRLLVGTPVTGLVRIEWVLARYGQLIPTNWSLADVMQWMPTVAPLEYVVSDAQNLIVRSAVEQDSEWLLLLEQDNILPPNAFWRLNEYMRKGNVPVVSGLYFTKSNPPEPMIYRTKGGSYYDKWKMGDKVWASGVPTGCLLIHMSILREMWNESPEYRIGDQVTRRVFSEPAKVWFDPDMGRMVQSTGTSDLHWCERVMTEHFFKKAGWDKYDEMPYPFLVDTNLFIQHIKEDGVKYPLLIPHEFRPEEKKKVKGKQETLTEYGIKVNKTTNDKPERLNFKKEKEKFNSPDVKLVIPKVPTVTNNPGDSVKIVPIDFATGEKKNATKRT